MQPRAAARWGRDVERVSLPQAGAMDLGVLVDGDGAVAGRRATRSESTCRGPARSRAARSRGSHGSCRGGVPPPPGVRMFRRRRLAAGSALATWVAHSLTPEAFARVRSSRLSTGESSRRSAAPSLTQVVVRMRVEAAAGRDHVVVQDAQRAEPDVARVVVLAERERMAPVQPRQPAGVRAALDRLLADREVDLIVAAGVLASDDACRRGPLAKPVIAPAVIDPELQSLPDRNGTSGVRNLSYLTLPSTIRRDVETFLTITPFAKLAVLVDRNVVGAIPELGTRIERLLDGVGITIISVPVEDSVDEVWAALPDDVEAVYLYPLRRLSPRAFEDLIAGLISRGLPTFSFFGEPDVRRGVLAGLNPDIFPRLSRRVALNVQRVLLGEEAGDIPTAFSAGERLVINTETARAIGKYPSWAVVTEAVLVGESKTPPAREWTLTSVMEEAATVNLDLAALNRAVASGNQNVKVARSRLLPQVDLSATGVIIDEDRAGPVTQAQRTLSGSARVSQVLFSDPALAGYSIERHLQEARVGERDALRLDVIQEAASAYLEVLRAMTLEDIQKENLTLSRQNLELARVRESIGQSGPSDVFRWESEIATSRGNAITANALRNVAEIALNRVLNRPLEEPFGVERVDITGADDLFPQNPLSRVFPRQGLLRPVPHVPGR